MLEYGFFGYAPKYDFWVRAVEARAKEGIGFDDDAGGCTVWQVGWGMCDDCRDVDGGGVVFRDGFQEGFDQRPFLRLFHVGWGCSKVGFSCNNLFVDDEAALFVFDLKGWSCEEYGLRLCFCEEIEAYFHAF